MQYLFNFIIYNKNLILTMQRSSSKILLFVLFLTLISFTLCFVVEESINPTNQKSDRQSLYLKATSNYTKLIWPLPTKISLNQGGESTQVEPCNIKYIVQANPPDYVNQMLRLYLIDVFKCKNLNPGLITLNIVVRNTNQMVAEKAGQQAYQITIRENQKWELIADYYVGFLRGLQTFSQLFQNKNGAYYITGRPILIDDRPDYLWRGLMIDSSRHFLSVQDIKHTIDALMYNKMSILHWHITDQDSFPMFVQSRPQLSQYSKFSGTYSRAQIKSLINYAKIRGVRIIPQFDTPAHTESWGRSDALKSIVVKCNTQYQGQFDPTLNLTYQVVNDVMRQVSNTFADNYVHFGGDQIVQSCYDKKPQIKQWMNKNNIATYLQLSNYYRKTQKKLWRNITSTKKAIYWANQAIDMPLQSDDVIQWWGVSKNVDRLAGRKNQVILSNYDLTYLDVGFGGRRGIGYGTFLSWRDVYRFEPRINNVNVIGGQTCLWSETINAECQDQKAWIRTSAFNERLWTVDIDGTKSILNIVERLTAQMRRMKQRGFKVSPVTVGLCEKDPSICFS